MLKRSVPMDSTWATNGSLSSKLTSASTVKLLSLLLRYELAEPLLLALKEREITEDLLSNQNSTQNYKDALTDQKKLDFALNQANHDGVSVSIAAEALASYRNHHRLHTDEELMSWCTRHGLTSESLLSESLSLQAHESLLNIELGNGSEESIFLQHKDRLDRVLYGLIRVESESVARDLFFAIEAGEIRFGEAARLHSTGPESTTEGIVGPVDLSIPHPEIVSRLRTAVPGELIPPFALERWFIILRLDYYYSSSLDNETRRLLRKLVLRGQAREAIMPELDELASWVTKQRTQGDA